MFRLLLYSACVFFLLAFTACSKDQTESSKDESNKTMHMANLESKYFSLEQDLVIKNTQVVFSSKINLGEENVILIQTEGQTGPLDNGTFNIWITIDGKKSGNETAISWKKSSNPQQHTYNAIALQKVSAGEHLIEIIADHTGEDYFIGIGSNLIIMVNPSPTSAVISLSENSPVIDMETTNFENPGTIPTTNILNIDITTKGKPLVVLASGISSHIGDLEENAEKSYGDAIWGIYMDDQPLGYNISTWGVNDIYNGAETTAPMYLQAFIENSSNADIHNLSLQAGEFPWRSGAPLQKLKYRVIKSSTLVALSGGFTVAGSLQNRVFDENIHNIHSQWDYTIVGSSESSLLPPVGEPFVLAEGTVNIPEGHNGVIMFTSKIRVQGDVADGGGTCSLWISIDDKIVGFIGVQQLKFPNSVSQRTITASFLATGAQALSPGAHQIKSMIKVDGNFKHLSVHNDMPLMWFD